MKRNIQSKMRRRKIIQEMDDGTLCIHFPDYREMVLIRWTREIKHTAMQVALIDDTNAPEKAVVVTGRAGARFVNNSQPNT